MSLRDNIYSKSHSSKPSAQAMKAKPGKKPTREPMFDLWLASRALDDKDNVLVAGAQRPITWRNLCLAWQVLHECASTMVSEQRSSLKLSWSDNCVLRSCTASGPLDLPRC